ncbi:MAG: c-type cytochrome biogenesis protein CcmI [Rhodospirillales bacterium]|nr:c-type cytochrome biogenesis protein CcmI [Rhodospirillales bacterium]
MTFWLIAGALTTLAVAMLLFPILRRPDDLPSRRGFDLEVYRDQLQEVERDLTRGVLNQEQAGAARSEIERRLLAADAAKPEQAVQSQPRRNGLMAVVVALAVSAGTLGLYTLMGAPQMPGLSLAERRDLEQGMAGDLPELVAQLARRMAENPGDSRGWRLLGRSYMQLGRYRDAVQALRQAIAQGDDSAGMWADLGEALIGAAEGVVAPEAEQAFASALERDPTESRSRYYSGLALAQRGQTEQALEAWQALLAESPADASWRHLLAQQVAAARESLGLPPLETADAPQEARLDAPLDAPGPSAEDMAAAAEMSTGEREDFIRSMVARLASQLEDQPDDLDGWLRLARAYTVLGEGDSASEAVTRAESLVADLPAGAPEREAVARARAALDQGG